MKTAFKVLKLSDGRVLAETPLRYKKGTSSQKKEEATEMLVLSAADSDFVSVQGEFELSESQQGESRQCGGTG